MDDKWLGSSACELTKASDQTMLEMVLSESGIVVLFRVHISKTKP